MKMIELINNIPENIGWVAVGVVGTLCVIAMWKLAGLVVEIIKDATEEEE
jgi:hypothetical protein